MYVMKKYIFEAKTQESAAKLALSVLQEDILFEASEDFKTVSVPELEAYRTGIPRLLGCLKPRECLLRASWLAPLNVSRSGEISVAKGYSDCSLDTGTAGNKRCIETGYRNGHRLDLHLFYEDSPGSRWSTSYSSFWIIFSPESRTPMIENRLFKEGRSRVLLSDFLKNRVGIKLGQRELSPLSRVLRFYIKTDL